MAGIQLAPPGCDLTYDVASVQSVESKSDYVKFNYSNKRAVGDLNNSRWTSVVKSHVELID